MSANEEPVGAGWTLVELVADGEQRLFIHAPGLARLGGGTDITLSRGSDPKHLTSRGWGDKTEEIAPLGVYHRGEDLYIEAPGWLADYIETYELVDGGLFGGTQRGVFVWEAMPLDGDTSELKAIVSRPHVATAELPPPAGASTTPDEDVPPANSLARTQTGSTDKENESQGAGATTGGGDPPETSNGSGGLPPVVGGPGGAGVTGGGGEVTGTPEPEKVRRRRFGLGVIVAALGLLLVLAAIVAAVMMLGKKEEQRPVIGADCTTNPAGCAPAQEAPTEDTLELFKQALAKSDFDTARGLQRILIGRGNAEAARISAELAGARDFKPGLYAERNLLEAYDLYRMSCDGGGAAPESLGRWRQDLESELQAGGGAQQDMAELVQTVEALQEACKP